MKKTKGCIRCGDELPKRRRLYCSDYCMRRMEKSNMGPFFAAQFGEESASHDEALHYGHAPRPVKRKGIGSQPKREQPMPPHAAIMESLSKIKRFADPLPEAEIAEADAPLLVMHQPMRCSAAFKAAAALIARRHAYAVLDDCLRRAQHRQLVKQEQAS